MTTTKTHKHEKNENHEKLHQELHQRYTELEYMNNHIKQLDKQYQDMESKILEISQIKDALDEMKKTDEGKEILVPMSNGIFVKAKLSKGDEFLVNVGSDVVVKKDTNATKELLDEQAKEINKYKKNIYEQMMNIAEQMQMVQQGIYELEKDHHH
jgi:prefoldin alpha subunit